MLGILAASLVVAAAGFHAANTICPDLDALTAIFKSLDGPNWHNKTGWLQTYECCNWHGIRCDNATNKVTFLALPSNGLKGAIPREIAQLDRLSILDLEANDLSGRPLPVEFAKLNSLEFINIRNSSLGGAIPSGLGNSKLLATVYLSNNALTGVIPASMFNCSPGTTALFMVDNNQLTGQIPPESGACYWAWFVVSGNRLSGQLPDFNNTMGKATLLLDHNNMTTILPMQKPSFYKCALNDNPWKCPVPEWTISDCGASCIV